MPSVIEGRSLLRPVNSAWQDGDSVTWRDGDTWEWDDWDSQPSITLSVVTSSGVSAVSHLATGAQSLSVFVSGGAAVTEAPNINKSLRRHTLKRPVASVTLRHEWS